MIDVVFEKENSRAAAYDNGKLIGKCVLVLSDKNWTVEHTETDAAYGGQGIGRRLVECVFEEAQQAGANLNLVCSYAKKVAKG